jgi:hypothetical protein
VSALENINPEINTLPTSVRRRFTTLAVMLRSMFSVDASTMVSVTDMLLELIESPFSAFMPKRLHALYCGRA